MAFLWAVKKPNLLPLQLVTGWQVRVQQPELQPDQRRMVLPAASLVSEVWVTMPVTSSSCSRSVVCGTT